MKSRSADVASESEQQADREADGFDIGIAPRSFRLLLDTCGAWRAHLIAWRRRTFIKDEGEFTFGETTTLDVSGRLHRVELHYAYSYRITSTVALGWRVH